MNTNATVDELAEAAAKLDKLPKKTEDNIVMSGRKVSRLSSGLAE